MNQNSLSQYYDKTNQRKWNSTKARIVRELRARPNQHSRELSLKLQISNEAIKKRLVDLKNEGAIEVAFDTVFMGRTVSVYRVYEQISMFPIEKKPTFRQWCKANHPEILYKYEALISHKL